MACALAYDGSREAWIRLTLDSSCGEIVQGASQKLKALSEDPPLGPRDRNPLVQYNPERSLCAVVRPAAGTVSIFAHSEDTELPVTTAYVLEQRTKAVLGLTWTSNNSLWLLLEDLSLAFLSRRDSQWSVKYVDSIAQEECLCDCGALGFCSSQPLISRPPSASRPPPETASSVTTDSSSALAAKASNANGVPAPNSLDSLFASTAGAMDDDVSEFNIDEYMSSIVDIPVSATASVSAVAPNPEAISLPAFDTLVAWSVDALLGTLSKHEMVLAGEEDTTLESINRTTFNFALPKGVRVQRAYDLDRDSLLLKTNQGW